MNPIENFVNISDGNKPSAGRIYDYVLGGNHNFEIDRKAAANILSILPSMPKMSKLIRWFLGEVVRRLASEGYNFFIDFASGLPTVEHIHQITPKGTKVIYTDIDPVTVAYGKDILGNNPDVLVAECDTGKPEALLDSTLVKQFIKDDSKIALGFNGIAWFMSDEKVAHFMEVTHNWAPKGTKLYICDTDYTGLGTDALNQILSIYKSLKQPLYMRSNESLKKLVSPWKIVEPGFMPLEKWIGLEEGTKFQQEASTTLIAGGNSSIQGAILVKE